MWVWRESLQSFNFSKVLHLNSKLDYSVNIMSTMIVIKSVMSLISRDLMISYLINGVEVRLHALDSYILSCLN
jgi:hypothetical protein